MQLVAEQLNDFNGRIHVFADDVCRGVFGRMDMFGPNAHDDFLAGRERMLPLRLSGMHTRKSPYPRIDGPPVDQRTVEEVHGRAADEPGDENV